MPLCKLQCPTCRQSLRRIVPDQAVCANGHRFERRAGIWHLLPADRIAFYARFLNEYETIRAAEGRGSTDPAHYRVLPYPASAHPQAAAWAVRAQSFEALLKHIIPPEPTTILDLGSGSGWLTHQLAQRGHQAAAIDLSLSPVDGLGALRNYYPPLEAYRAEFAALPFVDNCAAITVFNASFHYATDALITLREAARVSTRNIVIVDTPVYRQRETGAQMVAERHAAFESRCGFRSDRLSMINYLTWAQIEELAVVLGLQTRVVWPISSVRRLLRRIRAALAPGRPPAEFPLICFG